MIPLLFSPLLLLGCVSGPTAVEVTRFHLSQPLGGASIAVQSADMSGGDSLVARFEADAMMAELIRAGFKAPTTTQPAMFTASFAIDRSIAEEPRKSGISVGFGGGFGGRNGGIVSGVRLPVSKTMQTVSKAVLSLKIRRAGDPGVVWEGRAAASGTPQDVTAARLARALLTKFPGPSGQTLMVKPAP